MCGRFDIQLPAEKLGKIYQADIAGIADFAPRYNVAPTQKVPVLFGDNEQRVFALGRFGLVPSWWKHKGRQLINLRRETLREKPFFQRQLKSSRCVLPITGFFEWQKTDGAKKPFRAAPTEEQTFSLACIWEHDTVDDQQVTSFGIITGPPNKLMEPIHDRMPIILPQKQLASWLDPETPSDELLELLKTYPASKMQLYEVPKAVNNPRNDTPEVTKPVI